jgi:hypothetical protein
VVAIAASRVSPSSSRKQIDNADQRRQHCQNKHTPAIKATTREKQYRRQKLSQNVELDSYFQGAGNEIYAAWHTIDLIVQITGAYQEIQDQSSEAPVPSDKLETEEQGQY